MSIIVRGQIAPIAGREQELEALLDEFVTTVRERDSGTLSFGFYRDERTGRYVALEQYADVTAVRSHLEHITPLLERFGALVDGSEPLEVFAEPSDELLALYGAWNPVFLRPAHAL
jgi:quinol monooxygenase YgiN